MLTFAFVLAATLPQDPQPPRKPSLGKVGAPLAGQQRRAIRIPDGSAYDFEGMRFDVPKTWKVQKSDAGLVLIPAGANASGTLEEKYVLMHDPSFTSLDSATLRDRAQELADGVQEGLKPGPLVVASFGELEGRTIRFAAAGSGGKQVALRLHAFVAGKKVCTLAAFGFDSALAARDADLQAILGSFRTPAVPAAVKPAAAGRKPIPGGTTQNRRGVAFDLPPGWTVQETDDATVLTPPGANPNGVIEEFYVVTRDAANQRLEGADALQRLDQAVALVQPNVKRQSDGEPARFGDLTGRHFLFSGADLFGKKVEVRVHAFLVSGAVSALSAFGNPDALDRRAQVVRAILDSLTAPVPGTGPAPGPAPAPAPIPARPADVRAELVGQWTYLSTLTGTSSSSTHIVLTLNGNGTYTWAGLSSSSNPVGNLVGESREGGTWSAGPGSLVLTCKGNARRYALVKRNHPKNVNDPMIVLDGMPFVTAGPRAPWR